ncbi:MAG: S8/S53 family peptidase, partial [Bdellovibrionales bacterium]|nr:S8/S53 family peptidase [Bdellovibrionales bacterium]
GLFQFASLIFNLSFRKNKLLQAFHEHIDYISRLIKENNLSVVNISLGVGTRKKLPLKLSSLVMSLHKSLFDRVIATNPNTTFILAAGNDGLRMRNEGLNIAKNENVIYVGATSFLSYKASDYSNYSKTMVDVLADGNNIREELSWGTSFSAPTLGNTFIRFQLFNPDLTRDDVHRNFLQYSLIEVDDNSDYAIKGRTLIDGPYRKDTASLYLSNFTLHDIPSGYEVYVKPMASLAEVLKNEWDIEEYHKHRERGFMVGYSVDNSQVWALVKEDVVTPISPGSEFLALELKKLLLLPRLNKSCSTLLEGSVRISEPG